MAAGLSIQAPAAWLAWESQQHRACRLCRNGVGPDALRRCAYVEPGQERASLLPVAVARSLGGHCGPDAERLDFPGLNG